MSIELILERTFNAPMETVFKAWTQPEHLKHWWGPKGFTMNISNFDLSQGGVFHYNQQSPDGQIMWGKFVYREIDAPEKLVFVNSFSNEAGQTVRAPFSPSWPLEILNTLLFNEHEGQTVLTLHGIPLSTTEDENKTFVAAHDGIRQGFSGTFDQLEEYLSKIKD